MSNTTEIQQNTVDTKSIIEIRDGRLFYIPAYQRGYRWNKKQVEDLLSDLYTFATKKDKGEGEFYCLQPAIVKQITSVEKIAEIKEKANIISDKNELVYEVIDGQQRLTTLYILLRYLINEFGSARSKNTELKTLYQLTFETRTAMYQYLSNIEQQGDAYNNIDEKHACLAYQWIDEWVKNKATQSVLEEDIATKLALLLRQNKTSDELCGSVQFIWYEISEEKNVIREFLSTNNGKIKLTDAELIKALFLQKRNFVNDSAGLKQMEKALDWERIENTLHQDDFWFFINKEKSTPSNRIEYILRLAVGLENKTDDGDLFRHYNTFFDGKSGEELEKVISERWQDIIDCFRTIEDWYLDPIKYNYIGYLAQSGTTIFEVYKAFDIIKETSASQDEFIVKLKELVKQTVRNIKIKEDFIDKEYKHTKEIRKVLLLLNIHTLNSQLNSLRKKHKDVKTFNSPSYKFPFDVFVNQKWNVEHIDSATTNSLDKEKDKEEWITGHKALLADDDKFMKLYSEANWDKCLDIIRSKFEVSDEYKDQIGNLTLLDEETNCSYGNAIFTEKRRRILEEIKNGKYVPHCTQMVFYKNFGDSEIGQPNWNDDCKKKYAQYIIEQIKEYLS